MTSIKSTNTKITPKIPFIPSHVKGLFGDENGEFYRENLSKLFTEKYYTFCIYKESNKFIEEEKISLKKYTTVVNYLARSSNISYIPKDIIGEIAPYFIDLKIFYIREKLSLHTGAKVVENLKEYGDNYDSSNGGVIFSSEQAINGYLLFKTLKKRSEKIVRRKLKTLPLYLKLDKTGKELSVLCLKFAKTKIFVEPFIPNEILTGTENDQQKYARKIFSRLLRRFSKNGLYFDHNQNTKDKSILIVIDQTRYYIPGGERYKLEKNSEGKEVIVKTNPKT